jgi:hypothetical protein
MQRDGDIAQAFAEGLSLSLQRTHRIGGGLNAQGKPIEDANVSFLADTALLRVRVHFGVTLRFAKHSR